MKHNYFIPTLPETSLLISVEGNIGSGKSTFLNKISSLLNLYGILEPHTLWQNINGHNLLEEFYKNPNRWAYSFQTYVFLTRVGSLEKAVNATHDLKNVTYVMERSVYTDKFCFAKACHELGSMNDLEWNMYVAWYDWLVYNHVQKPHGIIYLRVEPEISFERTRIRNRSEEQGVPLSYLKLLHEKHDNWLLYKKDIPSFLENTPTLILDCNKDFEHTSDNWDILSAQVQNFVFELRKNF